MMMKTDSHHARRVLKHVLIVLIVAFIALLIGGMAGMALGGQNPLRFFDPATWQHVFSFWQ
jgi:hypothetical protein